jgi:hypothetical protein
VGRKKKAGAEDFLLYFSASIFLTTGLIAPPRVQNYNVIIHSGLAEEAVQSNGVQVGADGAGRFYDNVIIDSFGNNLATFGIGYNAEGKPDGTSGLHLKRMDPAPSVP